MLITLLLAWLNSFNVYYLGKLSIGSTLLKRLPIFFLSKDRALAPPQPELLQVRALEFES